MLSDDEDLNEARMDFAAAVWRIAHLAGQDALIEDLEAVLAIVRDGGLSALAALGETRQ